MRRHRELLRLNELLEEDLRNLKETDVMGPTTRMEYNFRKRQAAGPSDDTRASSEERKMKRASFDFEVFNDILLKKSGSVGYRESFVHRF